MLGEVLIVSRIANDMTIKEASMKAGVSVLYLTELEKLKRKIRNLQIITYRNFKSTVSK